MDGPRVVLSLVAPALSLVTAGAAVWVVHFSHHRVIARLQTRSFARVLAAAQAALAAAVWALIRTAPRQSGEEDACLDSYSASASLIGWAVLATALVGGVTVVAATIGHRNPLERSVLWVLALGLPFVTAFMWVPEAFCGWN